MWPTALVNERCFAAVTIIIIIIITITIIIIIINVKVSCVEEDYIAYIAIVCVFWFAVAVNIGLLLTL